MAKLLKEDRLGINPYWWFVRNKEYKLANLDEITYENIFGTINNFVIGR